MHDTATNLANLLTGQVGKNIHANQKKLKNRLAKALPGGESFTEASETQGDSKSKHRTSALKGHASKRPGSSALSTALDMSSQVVATGAVPEASSFQAVLVKVSGQGQGKEAKESSDVDSVKAVAPTDSSPAGQPLPVAQVQTAPAIKTVAKNRFEALTADSAQAGPEQAAQDSVIRQAAQKTIQQAPEHAFHAESLQQAGSQSKQPAEAVDVAAVQAKPSVSAAPVPSATVPTEVSEPQQIPEVSGPRVQQAKAQPVTDNSPPPSQGAAPASTAKTEAKTPTQAITADSGQVTPEQTKKGSASQQASRQTSGQIAQQVSHPTIQPASQPASQQAVQAASPQPAGVQLKQQAQAVDAAPAQATPATLETPVTSATALTDVSQVPQVSPEVSGQQVPVTSGQRVQQAKAQQGADGSASFSGGLAPASAATIVSEAPSVKSSVVASGGANKQAGSSVTPPSSGLPAGTFNAVAAQALANSDAAQAAAGSSPVVPLAGDAMSSSLTGQIAHAVVSIGPDGLGHQMVIQLNPPELGRVRLTLESRDDQIRGVLRVDDPGTLWQLRQEVPTLLHRLSESGLDVRQMDILPSHQGSAQSQTFNQGQDGQTARQQQSSPWRSASPAPVSQTTFSQAAPADDVQYAGGGSINTLA